MIQKYVWNSDSKSRRLSTSNSILHRNESADKWLRDVFVGTVDDDLSLLVLLDCIYTTKTTVIVVTSMQTGPRCRLEIRRHWDYNVLVRVVTAVIIFSGQCHGGGRNDQSQVGHLWQTRVADATTDQANIPILLRSSGIM